MAAKKQYHWCVPHWATAREAPPPAVDSPPPREACRFFTGSLDPPASTLVFGAGCSSSRKLGVEVTVYGCELHGRCVLFKKGDSLSDPTIKRCVECADNPSRATQKAGQSGP